MRTAARQSAERRQRTAERRVLYFSHSSHERREGRDVDDVVVLVGARRRVHFFSFSSRAQPAEAASAAAFGQALLWASSL